MFHRKVGVFGLAEAERADVFVVAWNARRFFFCFSLLFSFIPEKTADAARVYPHIVLPFGQLFTKPQLHSNHRHDGLLRFNTQNIYYINASLSFFHASSPSKIFFPKFPAHQQLQFFYQDLSVVARRLFL
jgi:hypothetical protein